MPAVAERSFALTIAVPGGVGGVLAAGVVTTGVVTTGVVTTGIRSETGGAACVGTGRASIDISWLYSGPLLPLALVAYTVQ
jgi:hypothetical protein